MVWIQFVALVFSCIVMYAGPQKSKIPDESVRNLSSYDQAGPFVLKSDPDRHARQSIEGEIRAFVWEHWREQRLGRIIATFYSLEGEPSRHEVFVEPDKDGRWRVLIETRRGHRSRGSKDGRAIRDTIMVTYDVVERIEPVSTGLAPAVVIGEEQLRNPRSYLLRLRNKETKDESTW